MEAGRCIAQEVVFTQFPRSPGPKSFFRNCIRLRSARDWGNDLLPLPVVVTGEYEDADDGEYLAKPTSATETLEPKRKYNL